MEIFIEENKQLLLIVKKIISILKDSIQLQIIVNARHINIKLIKIIIDSETC